MSTSRARRGFTLIELAVGMTVMSVILGMLVNAFLGSRKAQGQAVSMMGLKVAGSKALERMYLEISQSKRLLASLESAPAAEDIGLSYFKQLELPTAGLKPIPELGWRFPRIAPSGSFTAMGTAPGQLAPSYIGNMLIFVTRAPEVELATPGVTMRFGSFGDVKPLSAAKPFRLNRFRVVAYYLTEAPFTKVMAPINGGMKHTMNLVRWESRMYVDRGEIEGFFGTVPTKAEKLLVWKDLAANWEVEGAWDPTATQGTKALWTADKNAVMVPLNGAFLRQGVKPVATLNLEPYAIGMVAFNTNPNFMPLDSLRGLNETMKVPQFGEAGVAYPYGFEVGIVGPNVARSVLLRLSLAARLSAGNKLFGWSNQQLVQTMDN